MLSDIEKVTYCGLNITFHVAIATICNIHFVLELSEFSTDTIETHNMCVIYYDKVFFFLHVIQNVHILPTF